MTIFVTGSGGGGFEYLGKPRSEDQRKKSSTGSTTSWSTLYGLKSSTPAALSTSWSTKCRFWTRPGRRVTIRNAASATAAGVRDMETSRLPPMKLVAAVATAYRGQSVLHATPEEKSSRCSARETNAMAIFDAEYAACGASQSLSALGAGAIVNTCGLLAFRRYGAHAAETTSAPLTLTSLSASYRRVSISAHVCGKCVLAQFTSTSITPP